MANNSNSRRQYVQRLYLCDLPPEVRRELYPWLLGLSVQDHLNFLLSCRLIFEEGHEWLYHRPLRCSSQKVLIDFVNKYQSGTVARITNLSLRLQDAKGEEVESFLAHIVTNLSNRRSIHPYAEETGHIAEALSRFGRLRDVALLRNQEGSQPAPSIIIQQTLAHLSLHHTNIRSLKLEIDSFELKQLQRFTKLSHLQLSGFRKVSSQAILDVVRNITTLQTLQLIGPGAGTSWRNRYFRRHNLLSFMSPSGIHKLRPLARLEIFDFFDGKDLRSVLLNEAMVKAIGRSHYDSLEELTLSSTQPLSENIVKLLKAVLISMTRVHRLALTWPNMDIDLLDLIPGTTRHIDLAVSGKDQADKMMYRLLSMEHKLPHLKLVQLLLINQPSAVRMPGFTPKADSHIAFGLPALLPAASMLSPSPWKVKWGVWQPFPSD